MGSIEPVHGFADGALAGVDVTRGGLQIRVPQASIKIKRFAPNEFRKVTQTDDFEASDHVQRSLCVIATRTVS